MQAKKRATVLLADHDRWARTAIAAILGEAGLDVLEASNGVTALRMALADAPHVAILGRDLPEIGARELASELRQDQRTRDVAILAVEPPYGPAELLASVVAELEARGQTVAAAPIRSVSASPLGSWPLVGGASSRATSRMRNAGRSGKWRLRSGIETL